MIRLRFCWKLWWEKKIVSFTEWLKVKNNTPGSRGEWGSEALILLRLYQIGIEWNKAVDIVKAFVNHYFAD